MDILDDMGVSKLSAQVFLKWTTPLIIQYMIFVNNYILFYRFNQENSKSFQVYQNKIII